jgi:[ribosomal protein S5]-alanine N-acetyltransferase
MTEAPFLVGEKVLLRAVTDADVTDQYVAWLSDHEVTRFMGWRGFPSARHQVAEYVRAQEADDTLFLAIVSRQDQAHVGNIHLGPIDWVHRRAELAMILGDKAAWGKGYMTEAFELVIRHAFHTLNLHKLKAGTEAENAAAIRVFHKTGWVDEGRLRQETFRDGEFRDLVLFARFKDE